MASGTLNIDELSADPKLNKLEKEALQSLRAYSRSEESYEKDQARLILKSPNTFIDLDSDDYWPIFKSRLEDLISRPCAVKSVRECWHLSFTEQTFQEDIETFSSKLNGLPMKVRTVNVESLDLQTGLPAVRYPSVDVMNRGLPIAASLISKPCCTLPILSALIAWIYLYRLHLFEDGNGRVSRHIINLALRNYGVISEPKIFSSVKLYKNMRSITEHMTGQHANMRELIIILYSEVFLNSEEIYKVGVNA